MNIRDRGPGDARASFHAELEELRQEVVRLGAMVADTIDRGTQALLTGDLGAAETLIQADDAVDDLRTDVEESIYQMLATRQPIMSGDLRLLITALRLAAEIERSGDLVVNIVKGATRMSGYEIPPVLRGLVQRMSDEATTLMRMAVESYALSDGEQAAGLDERDSVLDGIHRDFIEALFESIPEDRAQLQCAVQMALIGRYYERIGDHAVNVGEWVSYLVTGLITEAHPRS